MRMPAMDQVSTPSFTALRHTLVFALPQMIWRSLRTVVSLSSLGEEYPRAAGTARRPPSHSASELQAFSVFTTALSSGSSVSAPAFSQAVNAIRHAAVGSAGEGNPSGGATLPSFEGFESAGDAATELATGLAVGDGLVVTARGSADEQPTTINNDAKARTRRALPMDAA